MGHFDPFRRLSGSDDEMIRRIYIFGTYILEFTEGGTIMHRAIYTTHVTFAYLYGVASDRNKLNKYILK